MAASDSPDRVRVLGCPVDLLVPRAVRSKIERAVSVPWDGRCRHIVTLNPEYVMAARTDTAFAGALRDADLVTADGIGVALAANLDRRGRSTRIGRVTGVEILDWLAAISGPSRAPLYLLGGVPGVAEEAAAALQRTHPRATVAGMWGGGTAEPEHDRETIERISASGARMVAVAYGAPGQVLWIERNRAPLAEAGVRLAIGVGGSFDFIAGRVPRAPAAFRRLGLEWLYRLLREPWRWRRQLVLPVFAVLVTRDKLGRLVGRSTADGGSR